ncbi:meiotic sister-chromatid recombination protein 3 [Striga asiatica]|uniref:Meiotic sister-chromatid recombination protein 3 n=1 Tax=Striga asiatica TaxID=4170 RepID=A0A5A7QPU5_STRAF|nr:meiotic sister-chromatid recombination protein 3 [Striga asiatica]
MPTPRLAKSCAGGPTAEPCSTRTTPCPSSRCASCRKRAKSRPSRGTIRGGGRGSALDRHCGGGAAAGGRQGATVHGAEGTVADDSAKAKNARKNALAVTTPAMVPDRRTFFSSCGGVGFAIWACGAGEGVFRPAGFEWAGFGLNDDLKLHHWIVWPSVLPWVDAEKPT